MDKTLIFFVSDNGAISQPFTRNYPLRGGKSNTLEGGIRVPFAVQWNGHVPANKIHNDMIWSLDIFPTATTAAGVPLPTDRAYDGLDVMPYLSGQQVSPLRNLFWRWFGLGPDGPPGSLDSIWAVRSGPLKLVTERNTVGQPPALYNLASDIGETQDLAAAQPADVETLTQLYAQWNTQTVFPLWWWTHFRTYPLVLAGDWDGFNKDDGNAPRATTRIGAPGETGTPDSFTLFTSTIHVAASGGDTTPGLHSFALIGLNGYFHQWGGVTLNIDAINALPLFSGTALGPTNSISLEDGYYYSFHVLDPLGENDPASLNLSVLKTSAPPISVSQSGQTPLNPTPDDPVIVSIATSQTPSPEERIYLR